MTGHVDFISHLVILKSALIDLIVYFFVGVNTVSSQKTKNDEAIAPTEEKLEEQVDEKVAGTLLG